MLAQFGNTACNAVNRINTVASGVSGLFFRSRPTAVLLGVIAVGILSINRVAFGNISHIPVEILKALPLDSDSTTPVHRELCAGRIVTPCKHIAPHSVDRSSGFAMTPIQCADAFDLGTSTGSSPTDTQVALFGDELLSTRASTKASLFNLTARQGGRWSFSDDFYSSKSLSDDYDFDRHNDGRFIVVFSSRLTASTVNCCDSSLKTTN